MYDRVGLHAGRRQDNAAREARDRADIEALMWSYTRALDTLNPEAYAAAYTPDGQFVAGQNATKGHAALKKMIVDTNERQSANAKGEARPGMYHMTLNPKLTFVDKDHARIDAYYLTVFGATGPLRRYAWPPPAAASINWSASTASGSFRIATWRRRTRRTEATDQATVSLRKLRYLQRPTSSVGSHRFGVPSL
jgi:hypothetical protein